MQTLTLTQTSMVLRPPSPSFLSSGPPFVPFQREPVQGRCGSPISLAGCPLRMLLLARRAQGAPSLLPRAAHLAEGLHEAHLVRRAPLASPSAYVYISHLASSFLISSFLSIVSVFLYKNEYNPAQLSYQRPKQGPAAVCPLGSALENLCVGGCWAGLWVRGWKGRKGSGTWRLSRDAEGVSLPWAAGLGETGLLREHVGTGLARACKRPQRGGMGWDPSEDLGWSRLESCRHLGGAQSQHGITTEAG